MIWGGGEGGDGFQPCYVTAASGGFQPRCMVLGGSDAIAADIVRCEAAAGGGTLAVLVSLDSIIFKKIQHCVTYRPESSDCCGFGW